MQNGTIPDAEPINAYKLRIKNSLDLILRDGDQGDNLVFCHGGVIRMLLSLLLKEPFASMDRFEVDYASLSVLEIRDGSVELVLHNFAPWKWLGGSHSRPEYRSPPQIAAGIGYLATSCDIL